VVILSLLATLGQSYISTPNNTVEISTGAPIPSVMTATTAITATTATVDDSNNQISADAIYSSLSTKMWGWKTTELIHAVHYQMVDKIDTMIFTDDSTTIVDSSDHNALYYIKEQLKSMGSLDKTSLDKTFQIIRKLIPKMTTGQFRSLLETVTNDSLGDRGNKRRFRELFDTIVGDFDWETTSEKKEILINMTVQNRELFDVVARSTKSSKFLQFLIRNESKYSELQSSIASSYVKAIQNHDLTTFLKLMDHRGKEELTTDLMIATSHWEAPLIKPMYKTSREKRIEDSHEIFKVLLNKKNNQINKQDRNGWTALMFAAKENKIDVVHLLLKQNNLNQNLKTEKGETVLTIISNLISENIRGNKMDDVFRMMKVLIDHSKPRSMQIKDREGFSAYMNLKLYFKFRDWKMTAYSNHRFKEYAVKRADLDQLEDKVTQNKDNEKIEDRFIVQMKKFTFSQFSCRQRNRRR